MTKGSRWCVSRDDETMVPGGVELREDQSRGGEGIGEGEREEGEKGAHTTESD